MPAIAVDAQQLNHWHAHHRPVVRLSVAQFMGHMVVSCRVTKAVFKLQLHQFAVLRMHATVDHMHNACTWQVESTGAGS